MVCWRQTAVTVACEKCGYSSTHNIIVNNHKTPANQWIIPGLALLGSNQLGHYSIIWLVDWCFNCHLDANHWPTQNTLTSPGYKQVAPGLRRLLSLSRTRAPFIKTISWDRDWALSSQCAWTMFILTLGHSGLAWKPRGLFTARSPGCQDLITPSSRADKNYVSSCKCAAQLTLCLAIAHHPPP